MKKIQKNQLAINRCAIYFDSQRGICNCCPRVQRRPFFVALRACLSAIYDRNTNYVCVCNVMRATSKIYWLKHKLLKSPRLVIHAYANQGFKP